MRVDGIILDLAQNSQQNKGYELARRAGCKVLFYDRCPGNFNGSSIVTNNMEASYQLTQRLIAKGYRLIYHFAGPSFLNISQERKKGYKRAMQEASLPGHIIDVDLTRTGGRLVFRELIESGESPEAIFAVNDPVAHGVYDAINELDLKIPGDVAVAGFGDVETSALLHPPMTSVKAPLDRMAEESVNMLVRMIEKNEEEFKTRVYRSLIVERDST